MESKVDDFIKKQQSLIEMEKAAEVEFYQQMMKSSSVEDLEQSGVCLSNMVLNNMKSGLFGKILYNMVPINYDKEAIKTNESLRSKMDAKFSHHRFGPGDILGFYEHFDNKKPDFTSKPVLQGVIYKVKEHKIVISVNETSEDSDVGKGVYSLCLLANEVTYNRYFKVFDKMRQVKASTEFHSAHLVNVLIDNESAQLENPHLKRPDIKDLKLKDIQFQDQTLNDYQKNAIFNALTSSTVYLIHGPPGTGKTKTVCEFIYQCSKRKLRVLACAGSNIAVDNMVERLRAKEVNCCRLGHPARLLPTVRESCLDKLLSQDDSRRDLKNTQKEINSLFRQLTKAKDRITAKGIRKTIGGLEKEVRSLEKSAVYSVLANSQVILCTNTGAGDRTLDEFVESLPGKAFDVVVIDECAQALEISCWIPMLKGKKVILAGDHLQLPPTIKSKQADKQGLGVTLFDRLMKDYEKDFSQLLRTQYRMNKLIMEWSSKEVYQGQLIADSTVENHTLADIRKDSDCPVLMLMDTADCMMGEGKTEDENQSKYNCGEADLVRVLTQELIELHKLSPKDIGIITPYNAQVDLIKQNFEKNSIFKGVECSTVDGFQGREKEAIIISMVRSNPEGKIGFLAEFRRMNVAVTRARRFCALVCDTNTIKHDAFLKKLAEYFEENAELRNAKEFQSDETVRFGQGLVSKVKGIGGNENQSENQTKTKKKKDKKKNKDKNDQEEEKKEEPAQKPVQVSNTVYKANQEEMLKRIMSNIDEFMKDKNRQEYHLPSSLNSFERMEIHKFAEGLNIIHESVGEGEDRHILLKKRAPKPDKKNSEKGASSEVVSKEEKKIEPEKKQAEVKEVKKEAEKKVDPPKESKQIQQQNQKPAEPKKKEKGSKKNEKEEYDVYAFLDSLIEDNKSCHYQSITGIQCKNNISTLGMVCKFCLFKFCTRHALAEEHGCGDQASADAKREFRKTFETSNTLKPDQADYLKRKLNEKIDKVVGSRNVKQNDKQKKK